MSDADRLKDKLAKLGLPALRSDGRRQVIAANETDFLRAVLSEVDETVLARKLTFHNDTGASFSLEVANRRLHGLTDVSPAFTNSAAALVDQQFSEIAETLVPHLTKLLAEFFAASQEIHVATSRLQGELDPGNIGCSAEVIAAANALVLYQDKPPVPDDRMDAFIEQCRSFAKAWVKFDENGIRTSDGDENTVERLSALAQFNFSDFDKQLGATFGSTPHCVIVGAIDNGSHAVLYVKTGGQGAFMAIPTKRAAEAHKYWRQSPD